MDNPTNPNQDVSPQDISQVKINQQTSSQNPPPVMDQPNANDSQTATSFQPPYTFKHDVGVGKPNIGVELESNKSDPQDTITVTSSKVSIPDLNENKVEETHADEPKIPENDPNFNVVKKDDIAFANMPPKHEEKPVNLDSQNPPVVLKTPQVPNNNPQTVTDQVPPESSVISTSEVQNIPIRTYDSNKTTDHAQPPVVSSSQPTITNPDTYSNAPQTTPQPPMKAAGKPAMTITVLALIALIIGGGGGFFGFKYWDNIKATASGTTLSSPSGETASATENGLNTYTNDTYKFTLSYPSDWVISTENKSAEAITFASNSESLSGDNLTGYRVEVTFEDSDGKTLKNFVESKAAASNEKGTITEITVDSQTAYQQALSNIRPAIATYIERTDHIMVLTYLAKDNDLTSGAEFYNNLINSITLQ